MITLWSILEAWMLVLALSADAFVSSAAYGANGIRIPIRSALVINLVCKGFLAAALFAGELFAPLLPAGVVTAVAFVLLFGLGIGKLFDSGIKAFIRRHSGFEKKICFSACSLAFILNIYADPETADRDCSKSLSAGEAVFLAAALSIDSLAVGFGAGMLDVSIWLVLLFGLIADMAAVLLGCLLGARMKKALPFDISWIGGGILVILAVLKLL